DPLAGRPSPSGWALAVLVAAFILIPDRSVHAQALEPRSYTNTPVGINFLLLGYGHTEGDVGFDAALPVADTRVRIDAGLIGYSRSLDVRGLSGKFLVVLPFAEASGSAKVKGQGATAMCSDLAIRSCVCPSTSSGLPRSRSGTSLRIGRTSSLEPAWR